MRIFIASILTLLFHSSGSSISLDRDGCYSEEHKRFKICPNKIWFQAPEGNECLQFPMILAPQGINVQSEIPRMTAWFDLLPSFPCAVNSKDSIKNTGYIDTEGGLGFECQRMKDFRAFAERQTGRASFDPKEKPKYCEGIYEFIMGDRYLRRLVGL